MASVRLFQAAHLLTKSQYSLTRLSPTGKKKRREILNLRKIHFHVLWECEGKKDTHSFD